MNCTMEIAAHVMDNLERPRSIQFPIKTKIDLSMICVENLVVNVGTFTFEKLLLRAYEGRHGI